KLNEVLEKAPVRGQVSLTRSHSTSSISPETGQSAVKVASISQSQSSALLARLKGNNISDQESTEESGYLDLIDDDVSRQGRRERDEELSQFSESDGSTLTF